MVQCCIQSSNNPADKGRNTDKDYIGEESQMDLIWGESIVYHPKDNLGQKIKAAWDRPSICDDYTLDLMSMVPDTGLCTLL